jgi:4-hydroxyphenylpyruvate dioxygenase
MTTSDTVPGGSPGTTLGPLSIATVSLGGPLYARLAAAAAAGFSGVEIFEPDLAASGLHPADLAGICARLGLEVYQHQPLRDFETADPAQARANMNRASAMIDTAAALGARTLLVCSSTAADAPDDPAETGRQLLRLAHLAGESGVRIAYEAMGWGWRVHTWQQAREVVAAAGCPQVGLCLDSFQVLYSRSGLAGIAQLPAELIFSVQLADAPEMELEMIDVGRHHRCFPGQGRLDVGSFTRAVLATGWRGPLALEIFSDAHRAADPAQTAAAGMESLLTLAAGLVLGRREAVPVP